MWKHGWVVVYTWCWSYRSIRQLEYSWRSISYIVHISSLQRGLLTPALIDPAWYLFTLFVLWIYCVNITQWTQERQHFSFFWFPRVLILHDVRNLKDDHLKNARVLQLTSVGIGSGLQLGSSYPSKAPWQASITKKHGPSPVTSASKVPIRVNL